MNTKLQQLQAMPIHGNAHDDMPLFRLADEIILDDASSMEEKIAAIQRINDAQGEDERASEKDVADYIAAIFE